MRKPLGALLVAVALTTTAACGASGGEDAADDTTTTTAAEQTTTTTEAEETTTTEAEADGVDLEEWAGGFCGDFEGWIADIQETSSGVSDGIDPGDVEGAKAAIVGLFDEASSHTDDLIASLEDGGAPAIDDGEALVEDLIGKFEDFNTAIDAAKVDAEALATDDPAAFQTGVQTLVGTFQDEVTKVGESFSELDTDYPDPELSAALSDACTSF